VRGQASPNACNVAIRLNSAAFGGSPGPGPRNRSSRKPSMRFGGIESPCVVLVPLWLVSHRVLLVLACGWLARASVVEHHIATSPPGRHAKSSSERELDR
jgi:hypothetical protein